MIASDALIASGVHLRPTIGTGHTGTDWVAGGKCSLLEQPDLINHRIRTYGLIRITLLCCPWFRSGSGQGSECVVQIVNGLFSDQQTKMDMGWVGERAGFVVVHKKL